MFLSFAVQQSAIRLSIVSSPRLQKCCYQNIKRSRYPHCILSTSRVSSNLISMNAEYLTSSVCALQKFSVAYQVVRVIQLHTYQPVSPKIPSDIEADAADIPSSPDSSVPTSKVMYLQVRKVSMDLFRVAGLTKLTAMSSSDLSLGGLSALLQK